MAVLRIAATRQRKRLAMDCTANTEVTGPDLYWPLHLVTGNHVETRRPPEQRDVARALHRYDNQVADSNAGDSSSSTGQLRAA